MLLYRLGYLLIAVSGYVTGFVAGFALAGGGAAFTSGSLSVDDQRAAYSTFSKSGIVERVVGPACGVLASLISTLALNLPIFLSGVIRSAAILTFEDEVVSQSNRAVVFSFLGTVTSEKDLGR